MITLGREISPMVLMTEERERGRERERKRERGREKER
jgi:hypothetical protein